MREMNHMYYRFNFYHIMLIFSLTELGPHQPLNGVHCNIDMQ